MSGGGTSRHRLSVNVGMAEKRGHVTITKRSLLARRMGKNPDAQKAMVLQEGETMVLAEIVLEAQTLTV